MILKVFYFLSIVKAFNINCCLFYPFPTPLPPQSFIVHSVAIVTQTVDVMVIVVMSP